MQFRQYVLGWLLVAVSMPCFSQHADTSRRYDIFFLEAICQREKGNSDAAFELLRHCVEIDSTKAEAYFYLAQYYAAMKQRERSLACSEKAARLEPENSTYLETLAEAYMAARRYDDAIASFEQLYDKNRDRDDVLPLLAHLYEQQKDYDNAIRTLEKIEEAEGKSERLSYNKSNLYSMQGNQKAAIEEMKRLADQYPNDLNYRGLYANTLFLNGQKKKALEIYDNILKTEPDNRNALMALRAYHKDEGDSLKAEQLLEQILVNKNNTTQDRVLMMREAIGESEATGGDSTRVLQLFRLMLQQPQEDADIAILCATYMNLKKMPQDTIAVVLQQALEVQPDNAAARLQLVNYAWQADDMDKIVDLCKAARQYNPDEMAFYYYQGMAYYRKNDTENALSAFQNGISVINSESDPAIVSDFYAVMGDLLHQKGLDKEAYAAYDSCLQWKDDNYGCLNNYAYYLSEQGKELDKAEKMSFRAIKAEPENATYLDTYAWILFMQGRYNEAKIYIDQTLKYDSDSSSVLLEHAGDIYYKAGDANKALAFWQKALDALATAGNTDTSATERRPVLIRKIKLKKYLKE